MEWSKKYEKYGILAFQEMLNNKSYTKEFKLPVVEEYITEQSSLEELIIKYDISANLQNVGGKVTQSTRLYAVKPSIFKAYQKGAPFYG